jgi:hypothetical protein
MIDQTELWKNEKLPAAYASDHLEAYPPLLMAQNLKEPSYHYYWISENQQHMLFSRGGAW